MVRIQSLEEAAKQHLEILSSSGCPMKQGELGVLQPVPKKNSSRSVKKALSTPWRALLGVQARVLSDLSVALSPPPSAPLPFSPQWLPSRSGLIVHTSITVPTVSEYQVSSAACLGLVPGNRNPNHTVRGFILLPWIQYTTLWQERTHLEKNRLYTRMWTCHKIHFSFQLKLPLLKRSHYRAVWQHKAQQKKKATTVRLGDGRGG